MKFKSNRKNSDGMLPSMIEEGRSREASRK
jgi:hypothetical protein